MLKVQLKSKIFQLGPKWQENEDILTGDFFGVLDYLPRYPYIYEFISYTASLNPDIQPPCLENVDWDKTKIIFWPKTSTDEQNAEPDIVIISDRWVIVIEVKLQSSFGDSQPWREYIVGCKIAQEHSISCDSVYYFVLARNSLDIASTFKADETDKMNKLATKTLYLKWHEAVSMVESWLRVKSYEMHSEYRRMLSDLFNAMRKRRAIAFSGFAFANMAFTENITERIFCPPRFSGFQYKALETQLDDTLFLNNYYQGFMMSCPNVNISQEPVFFVLRFYGFIKRSLPITKISEGLFYIHKFSGFLNDAPVCTKNNHFIMKGPNK